MKFKKYTNANIYFISGEKYRIQHQRVYGLETSIKDKTGKEFQVFAQDKLKFVADIRANNPKIGVIIKGTFMAVSSYESLILNSHRFETRILQMDLIDQFNILMHPIPFYTLVIN